MEKESQSNFLSVSSIFQDQNIYYITIVEYSVFIINGNITFLLLLFYDNLVNYNLIRSIAGL